MKALVLTGVKEFEIQNMPTPQIEPNEVLINTAYAGVCGTDHDLYDGRPGSAAAVPPIVLGHENSGIVAAVFCKHGLHFQTHPFFYSKKHPVPIAITYTVFCGNAFFRLQSC